MANAFEKKWFLVFCWIGFLVTFGAGVGMFILPERAAALLQIPTSGFNPFFSRLLAMVLLPFGLCYLVATMDPDASRSLVFAVTSEKVLAVLYSIGAYAAGTVGPKIFLVIVGDGLLALVGIYAVLNFARILETLDSGEEGDEDETPDQGSAS